MNIELKKTIHACVGASVPCIAISTTETAEVIKQVTEYAFRHTQNNQLSGLKTRRRVLVWRESVGFEEYAIYAKNETGEEVIVDNLSPTATDYKSKKIPGVTISTPNKNVLGGNVPFAVQYMSEYQPDEEGRGAIFILRDWHRFINANADHVDRQLALLEDLMKGPEKTVILLSPGPWDSNTIPIELDLMIYRTKLEMPDKELRDARIKEMHSQLVQSPSGDWDALRDMEDALLESMADATAGLTRMQLENVLCMSLASKKTLDVDYILSEKKKLVEQAGFKMTRPSVGFEMIGGLTPLKEWSARLRKRFTQAARDYGFPRYPRGLLMAGVPGCGKSAIAQALANEWDMNLLTVEATDLKGSLVGESEAKVQRLLSTARAAAPIIVFVDEAEKLLGKSEGIHDGGAHDAVLGQFLSFMQEDDSGVFFVFTANNMEKFAPELVDRFEGRFFIDLPSALEREEILRIHLNYRKQDAEKFDMAELVRATKDFSGRNIEDSIEEAMGIAFNEDRETTSADMLATFSKVIPTSETKKDEIQTMRSYVENGMMRRANDTVEGESEQSSSTLRNFV